MVVLIFQKDIIMRMNVLLLSEVSMNVMDFVSWQPVPIVN